MKQGEKPVLIIHEGERAGQRWTIQNDTLTVGRGTECDLVLPERQVSRQHIKIKLVGEQYYIQDLDSKNGTWVNGQQLKGARELRDGDEIHLALAVRIRFIGSGATSPLATEVPAFNVGRLRLDPEARRVFIKGEE